MNPDNEQINDLEALIKAIIPNAKVTRVGPKPKEEDWGDLNGNKSQSKEEDWGLPKAPQIISAAAKHMQDRASTYDSEDTGERSMEKTVEAFNAITNTGMTIEEGWLFMLLLKAVRSQQGNFRLDNYEDGAAYFALMGEQAAQDRS